MVRKGDLVRGLLIVLSSVFFLGLTSAIWMNETSIPIYNSSGDLVNYTSEFYLSSASNIYAYELAIFNTGTFNTIRVNDSLFLKNSSSDYTTSYINTSNNFLMPYSSRLDATKLGKNSSGSTLLLNVTSLSQLNLVSGLFVYNNGTEELVIFDNSCEAILNCTCEYYHNCTIPVVPPTTGGSGGGSGGSVESSISTNAGLTLLSVEPESFTFNLVKGKSAVKDFVIKNNGNLSVYLRTELIGFNGTKIEVPRGVAVIKNGQSIMPVNVTALESGLVTGKIIVNDGNGSIFEIPVVVNIKSENFLFDNSITIPNWYKTVKQGDEVSAQIDLLQVGPQEKVDVTATYVVKGFSGKIYSQESETFFVLGSKTYTKKFSTAGLPEGKYIIGLEILYPGAFATSSAQFEVNNEKAGLLNKLLEVPNQVMILVFWAVLTLGIVLAVIHYKYRKTYKHHRKI
jgi:hypothetical protein